MAIVGTSVTLVDVVAIFSISLISFFTFANKGAVLVCTGCVIVAVMGTGVAFINISAFFTSTTPNFKAIITRTCVRPGGIGTYVVAVVSGKETLVDVRFFCVNPPETVINFAFVAAILIDTLVVGRTVVFCWYVDRTATTVKYAAGCDFGAGVAKRMNVTHVEVAMVALVFDPSLVMFAFQAALFLVVRMVNAALPPVKIVFFVCVEVTPFVVIKVVVGTNVDLA